MGYVCAGSVPLERVKSYTAQFDRRMRAGYTHSCAEKRGKTLK